MRIVRQSGAVNRKMESLLENSSRAFERSLTGKMRGDDPQLLKKVRWLAGVYAGTGLGEDVLKEYALMRIVAISANASMEEQNAHVCVYYNYDSCREGGTHKGRRHACLVCEEGHPCYGSFSVAYPEECPVLQGARKALAGMDIGPLLGSPVPVKVAAPVYHSKGIECPSPAKAPPSYPSPPTYPDPPAYAAPGPGPSTGSPKLFSDLLKPRQSLSAPEQTPLGAGLAAGRRMLEDLANGTGAHITAITLRAAETYEYEIRLPGYANPIKVTLAM